MCQNHSSRLGAVLDFDFMALFGGVLRLLVPPPLAGLAVSGRLKVQNCRYVVGVDDGGVGVCVCWKRGVFVCKCAMHVTFFECSFGSNHPC